MRIATFEHQDHERVGLVEGDHVRPLPPETDVIELLGADEDGRDLRAARAGTPIALEDVRLRPPLQPPSIRDFVGFEQHIEAMLRANGEGAQVPDAWYEAPGFYFSNPAAVLATGDEVEVPPGAERLDFELEVAALIGAAGRDLTLRTARSHIAGYTILNDWSARDLLETDRRLGMGWAKGKDFATTLGPWIVTADELEDRRTADGGLDLTMTASVNGERIGSDSLANLGWSFEQMLVYASRGVWLRPGDVIGSGTCGGGCLKELWGLRGELKPPPLRPGDEVTLTVEGIGTITNRVAAGTPVMDVGSARRRRP
jgi:2-keto-4-pentenoate hydratase/2-oxohepta-3-ene-1,7-dioic acid hydratase in catechol pathway